jgi:hypothetical protein
VLIGAGDVHGERGATLVDQDVDLGAALAGNDTLKVSHFRPKTILKK